jgi:aminopeptidase N
MEHMSTNLAANLSREETAARSASVSLHSIRVEIDVTGAVRADETGFLTTTTLRFDATAGETWLDFIGEAVERVTVNGTEQHVAWDGARIRVTDLQQSNEVRIDAIGAYSRSGEGLHRFTDPVDGATYLYTQYEPADSRRVMACFEQPDMKAEYTFVVTAPAGWQVLSNQSAVVSTGGGSSQTVEFAPTKRISSYITSIAAGPYHRVSGTWTKGEQRVDLGVFCRASLAEHLDHDEILEITRQGLDFFDESFDFAYPWGKYDQIFVPEYNLGAMENPGLVTFTEAYVFRGAATEAQREGRANTILHEMAHMWFGDLVTMTWWDDLWLKESFADYMGSHASATATRFTDAWASFANRRKAWAYEQDQLPTTHPIVADIPDLEAAKLNFDGITYAKGASVLKQLVAFVGEDAFFAGARAYFRDHAYGNTTLDDLLAALEASSGRDMRAWSTAWLETTGVSTLALEDERATLVQTDPRPHRLRVGAFALVDGSLVRTASVDLDIVEERTPIELPDADLVLVNDGDLTYAKARLDERSLKAVERSLSTIDDSLARGIVWSSLWNATRDGELPALRYLEIVRRHAPAEAHVGILAGALANAAFTIEHYVADDARADARAMWLETVWEGLEQAEPGTGSQLSWARALGHAASVHDARSGAVAGMLDGSEPVPDGLSLDADLRWLWVQALAAVGTWGKDRILEELALDDTMSGRTAAVEALASRPARGVGGRVADERPPRRDDLRLPRGRAPRSRRTVRYRLLRADPSRVADPVDRDRAPARTRAVPGHLDARCRRYLARCERRRAELAPPPRDRAARSPRAGPQRACPKQLASRVADRPLSRAAAALVSRVRKTVRLGAASARTPQRPGPLAGHGPPACPVLTLRAPTPHQPRKNFRNAPLDDGRAGNRPPARHAAVHARRELRGVIALGVSPQLDDAHDAARDEGRSDVGVVGQGGIVRAHRVDRARGVLEEVLPEPAAEVQGHRRVEEGADGVPVVRHRGEHVLRGFQIGARDLLDGIAGLRARGCSGSDDRGERVRGELADALVMTVERGAMDTGFATELGNADAAQLLARQHAHERLLHALAAAYCSGIIGRRRRDNAHVPSVPHV